MVRTLFAPKILLHGGLECTVKLLVNGKMSLSGTLSKNPVSVKSPFEDLQKNDKAEKCCITLKLQYCSLSHQVLMGMTSLGSSTLTRTATITCHPMATDRVRTLTKTTTPNSLL